MKKVSKVYQNVAYSIASLYSIPIPLDKIAEDEGLRVIYDDYGKDTFDGMTWYEPQYDLFFIHINEERGNSRGGKKGRFTLAHELGHYFIDHHRHALIDGKMQPHIHRYEPFGKNEEWAIEREADEFAASLLMPMPQFEEDLRGKAFSGQLLQDLSAKYQVSFSACAIRYMNLNIVPVMLIYAEKGRIKWQMHSEDFPFFRLKYDKNKVPENTVMGDYFYNQEIACCKQSEIVYAGDCFHTFTKDQNNMQFYEYCIPYKDFAFSVFLEKY